MNILHIACITEIVYSGVCAVVPQHIIAQAKMERVAFINVNNVEISKLTDYQILYTPPFDISDIEKIFARPDIVVFHECYRGAYLKIFPVLARERIPYVIIPHGELSNEAQRHKWLKKRLANVLFFNRFVVNASAVQFLSEREKNSCNFVCKKIVATNGVCIPKQKKEGFSKEKVKITYIGRLDAYHKGLDLMIQAVSEIANELRNSKCIIELYGPHTKGRDKNIKRLINNAKVNDIMTLYEAISGEEKKKQLLSTDIFIQTSRFEGMPVGILEAMSYGIPCLVTKGTTLGEEISKNQAGWCAEDNVQSIAKCIKYAISNKDTFALYGENARRLVEKSYCWNFISAYTIDTYSKLIDKNK